MPQSEAEAQQQQHCKTLCIEEKESNAARKEHTQSEGERCVDKRTASAIAFHRESAAALTLDRQRTCVRSHVCVCVCVCVRVCEERMKEGPFLSLTVSLSSYRMNRPFSLPAAASPFPSASPLAPRMPLSLPLFSLFPRLFDPCPRPSPLHPASVSVCIVCLCRSASLALSLSDWRRCGPARQRPAACAHHNAIFIVAVANSPRRHFPLSLSLSV